MSSTRRSLSLFFQTPPFIYNLIYIYIYNCLSSKKNYMIVKFLSKVFLWKNVKFIQSKAFVAIECCIIEREKDKSKELWNWKKKESRFVVLKCLFVLVSCQPIWESSISQYLSTYFMSRGCGDSASPCFLLIFSLQIT